MAMNFSSIEGISLMVESASVNQTYPSATN